MPTVTVQGGGNSVLALQYTSNDVVAAADLLGRQITAAVRSDAMPLSYYQGTPAASGVMAVASVNNDVWLTPGNKYVIVNSGPAGYGIPVANAIHGAANSTGLNILTDSGGIAFAGGVNGGGTVLAGDAANYMATATTGNGGYNFIAGAGNDTINAFTGNNYIGAGHGNNTVKLGTGSNYVFVSGTDTITGGNGSDLASRGTDTITVNGPASVLVLTGNSNINLVNGSASSTVVGGYGSETIDAGAGGGLFFAGLAGHSQLTATGGSAVMQGEADGDVLTIAGNSNHYLAAGAGNETLYGAGSFGINTFVAGSGSTSMTGGSNMDFMVGGSGHATMDGGLGPDLFEFQNGAGGGQDTIVGFNPTQGDLLYLPGFAQAAERDHAVATQVSTGGSTTLTLSDNTKITFVGVASISAQSFYVG